MIKNWKMFSESNIDNFKPAKEVLDNIKDIILPLRDNGNDIRVFIKSTVEEFGKVKLHFMINGKIGLEDAQVINQLDNYLRNEYFESDKEELEIFVERKTAIETYTISKLLNLLVDKDIKIISIRFSYYLPDHLRYYNGENIFQIGDVLRLK